VIENNIILNERATTRSCFKSLLWLKVWVLVGYDIKVKRSLSCLLVLCEESYLLIFYFILFFLDKKEKQISNHTHNIYLSPLYPQTIKLLLALG
jgi:hypothetical protein